MHCVLVTGGAGFIGSHLVTSLVKKGYTVVVLDSMLYGCKIPSTLLDSIEIVKGDVCDKEIIMEASKACKYIFNYAPVVGVKYKNFLLMLTLNSSCFISISTH